MPRPRSSFATLILAAALVAVQAADAAAQERPRNGLIAFQAKRDGARVVYTRRSNGTGLRRARTTPGAYDPAFSARGRRLLFTRRGSFGTQLWITYLDGRGQRALTEGPSDGMGQWSPDGDEVVFARGGRGERDIYRLFADGTQLRRLSFSFRDDHSPSWSRRDRIAFVRTSGRTSGVYTMRSNGGTPVRLTRGRASETNPAWSPTGRTLVVSRGRAGKRDLYLVRANGASRRRLTATPGDEVEPSFSHDGTRIVFTHRRRGKRRIFLMKVRGKPIRRLPRRSRRVRRIATSGSGPGQPTWQPTDLAPVISAAGDIACDPASPYFFDGNGTGGVCRQKITSDLLLRSDLSSVLPLGDIQYEDGLLSAFQQSFHPTWGRMKHLMRPIPGNHEYHVPGAVGYFDYFNGVGQENGPAGQRGAGYYSFDLGTWHLIALNSECEPIGGCEADSPQMNWLRSDLAANSRACTLVYWHRPPFASGGHSDQGDMLPALDAIYAAGADVLLAGHEHFYERFAKQTPAGAIDRARGVRLIVAGMGGKSRFGFTDPQPNSEFGSNGFSGVLEMALEEGAYSWRAVRAPTGGTVDSGRTACH